MSSPVGLSSRALAHVALLWGIGGPILLLSQAIIRLLPLALEPLGKMSSSQIVLYGASVIGMAYSEGYRGFQCSFSPRVVRRALELAGHPRPISVALAPLYCMSLIHAPIRQLLARWGLLSGIVTLIVLVRFLDQPYRGIIDAGVVIGLLWGVIATLWMALLRARGSNG